MAELFLSLSAQDRRDALGVAADRSGRPVHLLKKDVWVVRALQIIVGSAFGDHLTFKSGASLSKVYGVMVEGVTLPVAEAAVDRRCERGRCEDRRLNVAASKVSLRLGLFNDRLISSSSLNNA